MIPPFLLNFFFFLFQTKYNLALEYEEHINIVTPDWVPDSLAEGNKVDEIDYHPRLLKQPKSHSSQSSESCIFKEKKRKDPPVQKTEELKKKEDKKNKEPEKKSLFDALEFSDDEENGNGHSLLDQLKTPQTWKQPITKPTVTTRASAGSSVPTPVAHNKPRAPPTAPISTTNLPQTVPIHSVTSQANTDAKGIAQGPPLQGALQSTTQSMSQVVSQGTSQAPSPLSSSPQSVKSLGGSTQISQVTVTVSSQSSHQISPAVSGLVRNSSQLLTDSPASVPATIAEVSSGVPSQGKLPGWV